MYQNEDLHSISITRMPQATKIKKLLKDQLKR